MALSFAAPRKNALTRVLLGGAVVYIFYSLFFSSKTQPHEIVAHSVIDRVTNADRTLDVQRHTFLQARLGRDERPDLLSDWVHDGALDFWQRFQLPFMQGKQTAHMDDQLVRAAIDDMLSLNGWVAAACPTLIRPFGQNKREDNYEDLARQGHLYYIAIVVHSADHFLVDQLAVIVQMARRLGPTSLFVSILDYGSTDSTTTLLDLAEAVLILTGVPFRIRTVPGMTHDPSAAYYPVEEAYTRNLALEPLQELYEKRRIVFHRVVWLKGFTCPNDILETIKVSQANNAAMVCGMDWAEHNGFFIFSDRWRTRDMDGDQFRQSKSSASSASGPPRDAIGSKRYAAHLPFQVFCCESGTHIVDPAQSYYRGLSYRSAFNFHNLSTSESAPDWDPEGPCMDSSQAWFCRDLWVQAAKDGVSRDGRERIPEVYPVENDPPQPGQPGVRKRQEAAPAAKEPEAAPKKDDPAAKGPPPPGRPEKASPDSDADAGSDFDAVSGPSPPSVNIPPPSIPNSAYQPARILINPRCVTTYAGVSHTKLAADLFGEEDDNDSGAPRHDHDKQAKYVLDDWMGAPPAFVCQEQRQTGGRKATKTQRRLGFAIHSELEHNKN
ncbi:alpha-1,3-mannosyltransferase CMT1 [Ceratobasidium sp. AG-Ba]|nr:alpha-1,3-mannosyltransferase CMT1 [Ceratobasidium sp. AG-Ba]